jgi:hypothetical protein
MKLKDFIKAFKSYSCQTILFELRSPEGVYYDEFDNHELLSIAPNHYDECYIKNFFVNDWELKDYTKIIIYIVFL